MACYGALVKAMLNVVEAWLKAKTIQSPPKVGISFSYNWQKSPSYSSLREMKVYFSLIKITEVSVRDSGSSTFMHSYPQHIAFISWSKMAAWAPVMTSAIPEIWKLYKGQKRAHYFHFTSLPEISCNNSVIISLARISMDTWPCLAIQRLGNVGACPQLHDSWWIRMRGRISHRTQPHVAPTPWMGSESFGLCAYFPVVIPESLMNLFSLF